MDKQLYTRRVDECLKRVAQWLESFDPDELARVGAEALGGKGGGGRPDLAQAGGPDGARADQALEAIAANIASGGGSNAAPAPEKRRSGSA